MHDQDRAAFEAAYANAFPFVKPATFNWFRQDTAGAYLIDFIQVGWIMWQAATAAERERAANVCIDTAGAFKESKNHAIAFGAYRCSDKIRSVE